MQARTDDNQFVVTVKTRQIRLSGALCLSLLCTLFAGCSETCRDLQFKDWHTADRVEVLGNGRESLKTIRETSAIQRLAAYAQSQRDGWSAPFGGTPIAVLKLDFYSGQKFLGHLGLSQRFLETQGCDDFVSRKLSAADWDMLLGVIGVREEDLKGKAQK
jgi:hypothetical protein